MRGQVDSKREHSLLLVMLALLGLLGYLLPWAVASSAPMTLNAYDLAEWASLHPAQRQTTPPLLAPLLLRVQLAILSLTFALSISQRWVAAAAVVALALAQLPPFEYVYDIANMNYRQQFVLALVSLVAGLAATRLRNRRMIRLLLFLLPVAGIGSVIAGVAQAFEAFRQPADIGLGPWLLVASYVGIAAINLLAARSNAERATN
ncbi:MAG: hypothetical protein F4X02_15240 [Chloroflexi bacterium]|nr:hypothetical protein [Chloroflexota bacterium]